MDVHKRFNDELKQRAVWIDSVREAAQELMEKAGKQMSEVTTIETQLQHVNALWERVETLARNRNERLEDALKLVSRLIFRLVLTSKIPKIYPGIMSFL